MGAVAAFAASVRGDEVLSAEELPEAMYALDDTSTTPTFYIDASCNIYGAVDLADLPIGPPPGRITKRDAEFFLKKVVLPAVAAPSVDNLAAVLRALPRLVDKLVELEAASAPKVADSRRRAEQRQRARDDTAVAAGASPAAAAASAPAASAAAALATAAESESERAEGALKASAEAASILYYLESDLADTRRALADFRRLDTLLRAALTGRSASDTAGAAGDAAVPTVAAASENGGAVGDVPPPVATSALVDISATLRERAVAVVTVLVETANEMRLMTVSAHAHAAPPVLRKTNPTPPPPLLTRICTRSSTRRA